MPKIGAHLREADGAAIVSAMDRDGRYAFTVDGAEVVLGPDDILVSTTQREGFSAMSEGGVTVVLDTALTPGLIQEGYVRELVSKIQTMRRDADFDVTDHIRLSVQGDAELMAAPGCRTGGPHGRRAGR